MKIQENTQSGNALIVVLLVTSLIGFTLASYLGLVASQNASIMRSLAWNTAVPVAEAGIEEAMAHINKNLTNRTADGWTLVGTNVMKERTIGDSKYRAYVAANMDPPAITSEGWVLNPKTGEYLPQPRALRVFTTNDALFAKGMVAKGVIDLNGTGITTDSYDPDDPALSTAGRYDATKRSDKGDIATNSGVLDTLNVWNAEIYGKASTGPGGNIKLNNGTVGSKAYHASGKTGIEPGWSSDDMNVQFPDVTAPFPITAPVPGLNGAFIDPSPSGPISYDNWIGAGDYKSTAGLSLKNKKLVVIGHARLYVTGGDIEIGGGSGSITIKTNASLQIYMNGASTKIAGNGVANQTGRASAFAYWGMPNNTQITFQGNAAFIGTIYAPNADFKLGGGGSSGDDFMGASITKSVTMGGHFKFHYDESLGKIGPRRGYTIVSWNEL